MMGRGRIRAAGLLVALGLVLAGAVSAQVRPDRPGPTARPAGPVAPTRPPGIPAPKAPDAPSRLGQVCVVAYEDRNANGRRDGGEGPLFGQSFTVANAAGAQLARGVTAGDGRFCTPRSLPFGDYQVRQQIGGGLTNTDPGQTSPNVKSVALRADGMATVLFGNCRGEGCAARASGGGSPVGAVRAGPVKPPPPKPSGTGQLCITKYNDLNANGKREPGEPGLPGWTFEAEGDSGNGVNLIIWTDQNGKVCSEPGLAIYRVLEPYPAGWINSEPGTSGWTTVNFTGDYNLDIEFGNYQPAKLRFTKIVTSTAPGGGFPAGKFKIIHECVRENQVTGDATKLSAGTTGPSGGYSGTPIGAVCTVTEELPSGDIPFEACPSGSGHWDSPVITSTPFTVVGGMNDTTVTNHFVCNPPPSPGEVCITKYNDQNNSGTRNVGEAGIPGWSFNLKTPNGVPVAPVTTAGVAGSVCYSLAPGTYAAHEVAKPGWTNTDPVGSSPQKPFTIISGQPTNLVFGNREMPGKVCVTKYSDLNGDGMRNGGDPWLAGWNFNVKNANGVTVTTLTSTSSGYPVCSQFILPPGNYTIEEVLPPGGAWMNTDPGGSAIEPFTVAAGGTFNTTFGNFPLGRICVRKYNDVNGNGAWSGASSGPEPFMTGVPFEVKDSSGQIVHTGLTAALGMYCTPNILTPGVYTVTETVPAGWTNTQPGGAASISVTIPTPYGAPTDAWFGNQKNPLPGELCVAKYNDLDKDGQYDAGEPPLSGWQFTRSGGGMASEAGSTGSDGRWCAGTFLPPGPYTVTETPKTGWINSDPGGGSLVKTAVVVTNQTTTVKFGNHPEPLPGEICVRKYNDLNDSGSRDAGEPPLSGWEFTVRNSSNVIVEQGTTGATGGWCMSALAPPGTYTVTETSKTGWINSDPVGAPVKTVVVGPNAVVTVWFGNRQP